MSMFSKAAVVAGLFGTLFIGYCIYFDRKRRSDPEFRKKLKQRRKEKRMAEDARIARAGPMPDLRDHEAVQTFFLKEVQLGEELLGRGEIDLGVQHLCNAIAVCGQPKQLLDVLRHSLAPNVFESLVSRLPAVSRRLDLSMANENAQMQEDDVE